MSFRLPFMGLPSDLPKLIQDGVKGAHAGDVEAVSDVLPNFIIIGAAKSATTTLTTILPRHPDFYISKPKEPKFFGRYYSKSWAWYGKIFKNGRSKLFRGEGSTMYTSRLGSFEHTPELMHRYLPDLKLIYVVRHPLDRIVSQWRHVKGRNHDVGNFEDMMKSRHLRRLVVGCSLYHQQLERFRAFYPDEQIHCLTFEDLIQQPKLTLRTLLRFLGASPKAGRLLDDGKLPIVNEAGDKGRQMVPKPEWPLSMKRRVIRLIKPDSLRMLAYMNKPSDYWQL
jgi:hypothetical protein